MLDSVLDNLSKTPMRVELVRFKYVISGGIFRSFTFIFNFFIVITEKLFKFSCNEVGVKSQVFRLSNIKPILVMVSRNSNRICPRHLDVVKKLTSYCS